MVIIAHASCDENKNVRNGIAGDQTSKEVCLRTWYNKPWSYVIRFTDKIMAERLAKCMEMAAANNNIGYDQNQRNTLLAYARKHNYDVSKVTEPCECDCSSLVSVALMYAGVPEGFLTLHGNCATTRTLRQILKSTEKVEVFTTPLYVGREDKLIRGDILLKEGSHVAVVVKGAEKTTENPYMLSKRSLTIGCRGESVKWLQWQLNTFSANLKIDGIFGKKTKLSVLLFQKDHKDSNGKPLVVDGIAGPATIWALTHV